MWHHAHYPGDPVFPPAFRDRPRPGHPEGNCGAVRCDDLGLRELPGFGDDVADNAPRWSDGTVARAWRPEAPRPQAATWIGQVRDRARMVQSIDRMLGRVLAAVDDNSYVVLTSDNGFHLGQHGLGGKGTAYDSDVHVPLLVVGPGVLPGARHDLVTNIDLILSYVAARSRTGLLVRLDLDKGWEATSWAWEYYDYREVGWERTNSYADPEYADEVAVLRRAIRRFDGCASFRRDEAVPPRCR